MEDTLDPFPPLDGPIFLPSPLPNIHSEIASSPSSAFIFRPTPPPCPKFASPKKRFNLSPFYPPFQDGFSQQQPLHINGREMAALICGVFLPLNVAELLRHARAEVSRMWTKEWVLRGDPSNIDTCKLQYLPLPKNIPYHTVSCLCTNPIFAAIVIWRGLITSLTLGNFELFVPGSRGLIREGRNLSKRTLERISFEAIFEC